MALDVAKHIKSRFGHLFEDVCGFIIRPERASYIIDDLGPPLFRLGEGQPTKYQREDIDLTNMRGMTIKCSWFEPYVAPAEPLPCVVYLHGNCGCRWDGLEILFLLKHGFTLFVYDACGSGHSDGDYVSLGFYERQDLAAVVEYLHQTRRVRSIGLWGRSMGSVTSIMYASKDPTIKCIVGDSPFASLKILTRDLVEQHGSWVPSAIVSMIVKKIRKRISKMAGFDINDLDCVKYAQHCDVPAFLFHGEDDTFVRPHHSVTVSNAYRGSCLHKIVSGDHNSRRSADALDTAVSFLQLFLVDKVQAAAEAAAAAAAAKRATATHRPPPPRSPPTRSSAGDSNAESSSGEPVVADMSKVPRRPPAHEFEVPRGENPNNQVMSDDVEGGECSDDDGDEEETKTFSSLASGGPTQHRNTTRTTTATASTTCSTSDPSEREQLGRHTDDDDDVVGPGNQQVASGGGVEECTSDDEEHAVVDDDDGEGETLIPNEVGVV